MTLFKIPRVAVYIPGETSRVKFVPEYELPLFNRLYRGRIADPHGDPLRLIPHPKNSQYNDYWYELEAESVSELASSEMIRLQNMFGKDEKSGETLFDLIYPGDYFNDAVVRALDAAKTHETDPARSDPADKILDLCVSVGLDRVVAKRLVEIGWKDVELIASADLDQLGRSIGKVRAAHLIKAAETKLNALINMEPAEQIAAAKSAAKGAKKE